MSSSSPVFPTCRHIKEDGRFCGSAALKDRDRCYFHLRAQGQRLRAAQQASRGAPAVIDLPLLEDAYAIQTGLQRVLEAVAADRLEFKRAKLLLYGLQLAGTNLKRMAALEEQSRETQNEACTEYPGYEQEFELGDFAMPQPSEEEIAVVAARRNLKLVAGSIFKTISERAEHTVTVSQKQMAQELLEGQNACRQLEFALAALHDREAQGAPATAFSAPPLDSTPTQAMTPNEGFTKMARTHYRAPVSDPQVPESWAPAMKVLRNKFGQRDCELRREMVMLPSEAPTASDASPRKSPQSEGAPAAQKVGEN